MQAPGFWDDQGRAAKVSAEHARVQRQLDGFRSLESDIDDLEELEALQDESMREELGSLRESVEERLAAHGGVLEHSRARGTHHVLRPCHGRRCGRQTRRDSWRRPLGAWTRGAC